MPLVLCSVHSVSAGGPASRAGLRPGVVVVQIEDKDVRYCVCDEVVSLIRSLGVNLSLAVQENSAVTACQEREGSTAQVDDLAVFQRKVEAKHTSAGGVYDLTGKLGQPNSHTRAPSNMSDEESFLDSSQLYLPSAMAVFGNEDRVFKNPLFSRQQATNPSP